MEVSLQSFRKRYTYDSQKDLLGKGGFGEVYKAYDNEDKIFVALKMTQNIANSKYNLIDEIKRFKKLNHPNIINHIEAYEVNTGSADIHGVPIVYHVGVLEFADQGTLADLLKEKNTNPRVLEDIAEDIINGLAYLHTQNIIHRDLKPSNILLFADGEKIRAKITDFGIAKRADATAASTQLIGTVEYMAPEFFSTGNITTSADVWSLGVMLIEAFTGIHPFGKTSDGLSNEQIIGNILSKDLGHISDGIHAPYKDIITRCLMREISIRPSNANEIKGILASPQNAFCEKTQVINIQKSKHYSLTKIERIKKIGASFLDFDFSKPKRKKLIAREILLLLGIIVFSLISSFLIIVMWNNFLEARVYFKKNVVQNNQIFIDSIQKIKENKEKRQYEFSKSYFLFGNDKTKVLYSPLGNFYNDIVLYNERNGYYNTKSEFSFKEFSDKFSYYLLNGGWNKTWLEFIVYWKNLYSIKTDDLRETLEIQFFSLRNASFQDTTSFKTYEQGEFSISFVPNEIKNSIEKPGWLDWFMKFWVNYKDFQKFKNYLVENKAITPKQFKYFLLNKILFTKQEVKNIEKMQQLQKNNLKLKTEINQIRWGKISKYDNDEIVENFFIFFAILFYPVRLLFIMIRWAIKTTKS